MSEQHLIKLQKALLEGRIDQKTYKELREDLLDETGSTDENNNVAHLFEEADVFFGNAQYDKTLILLDRIVELEPTCADAYFSRGWTYLCLGNEKKASENLKKSLHLVPKHVPTLCLQAERATTQNRFEEAIVLLNRAIQSEPQNAQPIYYRALTYESWARASASANKLAKALEDFQVAHRLNPECEVPEYNSDHPSKIDWVRIRGLPETEILSEEPLVVRAVPYVEKFTQTEEGRTINFYCGQCGMLQHHPATVISRQQECVECGTFNSVPSDVAQGAWKAVKTTGLLVGGLAAIGLCALGGMATASGSNSSGGEAGSNGSSGGSGGRTIWDNCPSCRGKGFQNIGTTNERRCPNCGGQGGKWVHNPFMK
ncbi:tetratricopeptide repeat protein [Gimesia sp.]|uniref:tetratricopeptide repeat protein n=1 Tax=Gimesia sp. TaxID=2024833 RepID=UPI0025B8A849|nr:tetratricopeptide repeat protein [Gimesia sp.]|tara:strand:+ start:13157 stop:14269 length:1113 start_codon:yes stop_codon:yes gene_type:complete